MRNQHYIILHNGYSIMLSVAYAECRVFYSAMLSVIILNVVRLSVVAPLFVHDEDSSNKFLIAPMGTS